MLVHGHTSEKEWPVARFAPALARAGIASVAYDLPDHGERSDGQGTFFDIFFEWADLDDLLTMLDGVTRSVKDGRWVTDYLETRTEVDPERIAAMGYSLGSYIGCVLTGVEGRIRGVVMNVGGTNVEVEDYVRSVPLGWAIGGRYFPSYHAPNISPRPVPMLNGLQDAVVPAAAQSLYDALLDPKEIRWYESGHNLPTPEATDDAASRLVEWFDINR